MPADPTTLDILIDVRANLGALGQAVAGIQQAMTKATDSAREFASRTETRLDALGRRADGLAAALTQVFGAAFAAQRLKQYADQAIEAQRAQAALAAALRATGQYTPELSARLLEFALQQLPPADRLVITLLELEELPVAEIAALTGWSAANVKVRAFRARQRLKQILEAYHE